MVKNDGCTLEELEDMTNSLPDLASLVGSTANGFVEYKTIKGVVSAVNLKNTGDVAVADVVMNKGAVVKGHQHEEVEIFIFYRGRAIYKTKGEEIEMTTGGTVIIEPGTIHGWEVLENSRVIAIAVPAAEGFPNG